MITANGFPPLLVFVVIRVIQSTLRVLRQTPTPCPRLSELQNEWRDELVVCQRRIHQSDAMSSLYRRYTSVGLQLTRLRNEISSTNGCSVENTCDRRTLLESHSDISELSSTGETLRVCLSVQAGKASPGSKYIRYVVMYPYIWF